MITNLKFMTKWAGGDHSDHGDAHGDDDGDDDDDHGDDDGSGLWQSVQVVTGRRPLVASDWWKS